MCVSLIKLLVVVPKVSALDMNQHSLSHFSCFSVFILNIVY